MYMIHWDFLSSFVKGKYTLKISATVCDQDRIDLLKVLGFLYLQVELKI